MPKVALYGKPGAGKSTLAGMLVEEWEQAGVQPLMLKVGAPLYQLQAIMYAIAGSPLLEDSGQDGRLLNVLGSELRRINPQALIEPFTRRVRQAEQHRPGAVLVCDDARAPDIEAVTALGFALVEITAPEGVRRARKQARADLSAGDDQHPTEAPVTAHPWQRVDNSGGLDDLRKRAVEIAAKALR